MGAKEILIKEIEEVPDTLVEEVIDFVKFLKRKALQDKLGTAVASESSLKKDWLLPEGVQTHLVASLKLSTVMLKKVS